MAHERRPGRLEPFIRKYSIELAALALILFAVFLLLGTVDRVMKGVIIFTISDLTGLILLIIVGAFSLWRLHYRLSRSPHLQPNACPRCHAPLYRVHRSWPDRLLGFGLRLELRRYRCIDHACNWTGLRLRGDHHHHARRRRKESSAESSPASEVRE